MAQDMQPNKPLSGKELRNLIVNDISSVLDQDVMLQHHVAYKQVAYQITVKIMVNNPIIPDWKNKITSKKSTLQQVDANATMESVEAFPLKHEETDEAMDFGMERTRTIESPNQSRIENGLKVPVTRRTAEGDVVEEGILYDTDELPPDGFPDGVVDRALTDEEVSKVD